MKKIIQKICNEAYEIGLDDQIIKSEDLLKNKVIEEAIKELQEREIKYLQALEMIIEINKDHNSARASARSRELALNTLSN
jgi:hypothetical protein